VKAKPLEQVVSGIDGRSYTRERPETET